MGCHSVILSAARRKLGVDIKFTIDMKAGVAVMFLVFLDIS